MKRRNFIANSTLFTAGVAVMPQNLLTKQDQFISKRPKLANRKFVSKEVERVIKEVKSVIKDEEIAWLLKTVFQIL